eukprot:c29573_g1_i1 orf=90-977(+)
MVETRYQSRVSLGCLPCEPSSRLSNSNWHRPGPQGGYLRSSATSSPSARDRILRQASSGKPSPVVISTDNGNPFSAAQENSQLDTKEDVEMLEALDTSENAALFAALRSLDRPSIASLLRENMTISNCIMVHEHIIHEGLDQDTFLCSLLVTAYGSCGYIHMARCVFDRMYFRNVVTWTTMISSYVDHGLSDEGLFVFKCMCADGVQPNEITFLAALSACANIKHQEVGMRIHALIAAHGFDAAIAINTALFKMYAQCGIIEEVMRVFRKMSIQDVVSWTAIITAYLQLGLSEEA